MKKTIKLCNYKVQTCRAKEICEAQNKLNGKGRDILCSTTHLQMNYRLIRGPACHLDKMNLKNIKFQDWEERAQVLANVTNRKNK